MPVSFSWLLLRSTFSLMRLRVIHVIGPTCFVQETIQVIYLNVNPVEIQSGYKTWLRYRFGSLCATCMCTIMHWKSVR